MHRYRRVGGRIDADRFLAAQLVHLVVEEVEGPPQQRPLEAGRAVNTGRRDHVGGRAFEDRLRLLQRLPAAPSLDDARVAGFGQRVSTEVGANQQSIRIDPAESRLGLGRREPSVNEFACAHVEFTHDSCIRTATGQADQGPRVIGFDDVGAGPHPVLTVNSTQFIDVQ